MSNANAVQKVVGISTVQGMLEKMKPQMAMALPKHITPERMMRVALTAVQNTPKLLECDVNSLLMAVLRAAQLGLEPDGILGQAYLIPYGKQVQLIPGYKGLIDLARRSGEVSNIIAREVYANDEFTVDFSQEIPFVHKPKLEGERGDVKFFWAMARFKDGGFHWDYMSYDEVISIRNGSSGWQNAVKYNETVKSPWHKNFIEMGKKTVIRRITKYLPMSVQRASVTEDLVDSGRKFSVDDFGEIILNEQDNEPQDITPKQSAAGNAKEALKSKIVTANPVGKTELDTETGEVLETELSPEEIKVNEIIDKLKAAKTAAKLDEIVTLNSGHLSAMQGKSMDKINKVLNECKDNLGAK